MGANGMHIEGECHYNTICHNDFSNIGMYSIRLRVPGVTENYIYHNNFGITCSDESGGPNYWDNGYPSGGNYWSGYSGNDNYHGINQDIPGSDGIGDTPHTFSGGQDDYPFMNKDGWLETGNQPPIAEFTWTPTNPKTGETITFDASSSYDPDGYITSYEWDWDNDGIYETTGVTATHSWSVDGNYQVTLRVTDDKGATDTIIKTVSIENRAPSAGFSFSPSNPEPEETISFSNSCSDLDGSITSYSWSFGDGESSTAPNPTHSYSNSGTYTVSLTVVDDDGASNSASRTINVNIPPTADFTYSPTHPTDLETVTFTDSSSDTDGDIASYEWDFGDGNTSNDQNPTHEYADNGTYTVKLIVKDDDGATDTKSKDIIVRNVKPTANFTYTPKSPVKVDTTLTFIDNSTDPDGNVVNWTWEFGDGTIVYENQTNHTYSKAGTYDVILTVTDDDGDTDSYTMTITVEKGKKGTPGFEFAFLIIAIASVILIGRRNQK